MRHGISTPSAQCLCQGFFTIEPEPNRRAKNEFVKSPKTKMMMKTCAAALLALAVAPSVQAEWTGNVMVVNLMSNYSLDFLVRHTALLSFSSFSFRLDLWWQPKGPAHVAAHRTPSDAIDVCTGQACNRAQTSTDYDPILFSPPNHTSSFLLFFTALQCLWQGR